MTRVVTTDRLGLGRDDFYNRLMQAHDGLSAAQSQALNARLVLLLANAVGDGEQLKTLLELATSYER